MALFFCLDEFQLAIIETAYDNQGNHMPIGRKFEVVQRRLGNHSPILGRVRQQHKPSEFTVVRKHQQLMVSYFRRAVMQFCRIGSGVLNVNRKSDRFRGHDLTDRIPDGTELHTGNHRIELNGNPG